MDEKNEKSGKKKLTEKGWFSVLMLFLFFPVGVFLLWKYHRRHKILNVILTVVFGFPFLLVTIAIFLPSESYEEVSRQNVADGNADASAMVSPKPVNAGGASITESSTSESTVAETPTDETPTDEAPATKTPIAEISTTKTPTTKTPATKTPTTKTPTTPTPTTTPQNSIDELRKTFNNYFNNKKNSDKNKLKKSNPKELQDAVIALIVNNQNRDTINMQTSLDPDTIKFTKRVCSTYLEIFDTGTESAQIKKLMDYTAQIESYKEEKDSLIKKYKTEDGNLLIDESEGVYSMSFYIQNALGVSSNSSIDKFLLDLGIYGNKLPPSYGATSDFVEYFDTYLPGEERCVVQPLSEYSFSQAGVYTLNVISGGEMEVVTVQGFKSFVPLYVEVSDEFVEQFSVDRYRFYNIDSDIFSVEESIKNLLGV